MAAQSSHRLLTAAPSARGCQAGHPHAPIDSRGPLPSSDSWRLGTLGRRDASAARPPPPCHTVGGPPCAGPPLWKQETGVDAGAPTRRLGAFLVSAQTASEDSLGGCLGRDKVGARRGCARSRSRPTVGLFGNTGSEMGYYLARSCGPPLRVGGPALCSLNRVGPQPQFVLWKGVVGRSHSMGLWSTLWVWTTTACCNACGQS